MNLRLGPMTVYSWTSQDKMMLYGGAKRCLKGIFLLFGFYDKI